jgi:hypothetical protein
MAAATTVNANSVLDESDDDADATGRRLQAWERAYEADRCGSAHVHADADAQPRRLRGAAAAAAASCAASQRQ